MVISGDLLLMTNDNPGKVTRMLKKRIGEVTDKQDSRNEKNRRH